MSARRPGGGIVELSQICEHLATLPAAATLILICDTCHAAAIAQALCGPQQGIALASCGDGQTMIDRWRSEFVVRLEDFLCATRGRGSLAALRARLEADTPDCERPVVWTHAAHRWSAPVLAAYLPDQPGMPGVPGVSDVSEVAPPAGRVAPGSGRS